MGSRDRTFGRANPFLGRPAVALVAAFLLVGPLAGGEPAQDKSGQEAREKPARPAKNPGAVEVHFNDGSNLKMTLADDRIEVKTSSGLVVVPVADVQRIEVGLRLPADIAQRVEAAVANLGSQQFREREAASAELFTLRDKAYLAVIRASKQKDPEVVRRAEELLGRLRSVIAEEDLDMTEQDVIHTGSATLVGWITSASLKVRTFQFGDQQLKLADVRSVRSLSAEPDPSKILPDPGNLTAHQTEVGKVLYFRVTGTLRGAVWGSDVYTGDSTLGAAAVHAGVLRPGQTGVLKVKIVTPPPTFDGAVRHGVVSSGYGAYLGAFRLER